jgi:predicted ATPase
LLGRERECEVLRGAVVRVVEGGSAFVLVVGEPGIGKSTLLATLSDLAQEWGLAVGFGRGQSAGAVPLWPWRSALESVAAERGQGAGELSRPLTALVSSDMRSSRAAERNGSRFSSSSPST